jgi:hypothetical protein
LCAELCSAFHGGTIVVDVDKLYRSDQNAVDWAAAVVAL